MDIESRILLFRGQEQYGVEGAVTLVEGKKIGRNKKVQGILHGRWLKVSMLITFFKKTIKKDFANSTQENKTKRNHRLETYVVQSPEAQ